MIIKYRYIVFFKVFQNVKIIYRLFKNFYNNGEKLVNFVLCRYVLIVQSNGGENGGNF